jgi:hypothetical protein
MVRAMAGNPSSSDPKSGARRLAASPMAIKWTAVHEAAAAVAELAGIAPEYRTPDVRNFPAIMRDTGGWRLRLAQQGVDDLAAILEPGLAALLALHGSGAPAGAAAQALWQEFQLARAGLLALIPPLGIDR